MRGLALAGDRASQLRFKSLGPLFQVFSVRMEAIRCSGEWEVGWEEPRQTTAGVSGLTEESCRQDVVGQYAASS